MKYRNRDNYRIDVVALPGELLNHWKQMLFVGIVFGILIMCLKYRNDNIAIKQVAINAESSESNDDTNETAAQIEGKSNNDDRIAELKSKMTDSEIRAAEEMYRNTVNYIELEEYVEKSLYMHLNPYHLRVLVMTFRTDDTGNLIQYILSDKYAGELAENLRIDAKNTYFYELISACEENGVVITETFLPNGIEPEAAVSAMAKGIDSFSEANNVVVTHLSDYVNERQDLSVRDAQNEIYTSINSYHDELINAHTISSNDTEHLYAAYLERDGISAEGRDDEHISKQTIVSTSQDSAEQEVARLNPVYAVAGFLVGIMFYICIVIMYWILSGKVWRVITGGVFDEVPYVGELKDDSSAGEIVDAMSFYGSESTSIISLGVKTGLIDNLQEKFIEKTKQKAAGIVLDPDENIYRSLATIDDKVLIIFRYGETRLADLDLVYASLVAKETRIVGLVGTEVKKR